MNPEFGPLVSDFIGVRVLYVYVLGNLNFLKYFLKVFFLCYLDYSQKENANFRSVDISLLKNEMLQRIMSIKKEVDDILANNFVELVWDFFFFNFYPE